MKNGGESMAHRVWLNEAGFTTWTVVHELAHAWDWANRGRLSENMQTDMGAEFEHPILHRLYPNNPAYWYDPGDGPPPCGIDSLFDRKEDFAESVTAYVYPGEAQRRAEKNE